MQLTSPRYRRDPGIERSKIVERWKSEAQFLHRHCKGCVRTKCKGCPGTLQVFETWGKSPVSIDKMPHNVARLPERSGVSEAQPRGVEEPALSEAEGTPTLTAAWRLRENPPRSPSSGPRSRHWG